MEQFNPSWMIILIIQRVKDDILSLGGYIHKRNYTLGMVWGQRIQMGPLYGNTKRAETPTGVDIISIETAPVAARREVASLHCSGERTHWN